MSAGPVRDADALTRAAIEGELSSTRELLERVAPRVIRVVRKVLGPRHPDVDDVAQEALIALVRALPAFRGECSPEGYAGRIAVRTAMASRKQHRRRREIEDRVEPEREDSPSAEHAALRDRRLSILRELLDELPSGQGETLALRVMLGFSLREIADHTEVPINTVRSRLRLAKRAMRERIAADPALRDMLEAP